MASHHLIREARRRSGLTQSELAARARTTQSAIARWESGRSVPSLDKLMVLVACCGLELTMAMTARPDAEWTLLARRRQLSVEQRLALALSAIEYREPAADAGDAGALATGRFDPVALLAALHAHAVRHVVIGGLAATLHGSPLLTDNLDITPAPDDDNRHRLDAALASIGAGGDATQPRVRTRHGLLGIVPRPAGTAGYEDLRAHAVAMTVHAIPLVVASLHDVVRSKEAAGRTGDRDALPTLRRLQQLVDAP